ncbi:MAG: SRPBCC family protein [Thermoleophilaceae bacterium]
MAVESTETVEREIRIDAAPETVFAFFTDPELLLRWKGLDATLEPEPGGVYRVVMNEEATVLGRFLEVEPPTRVVFSWGMAGEDPLVTPGASTVEVTLTADGEGTLLRLVHRDLPARARDAHARGWEHYLERLRVAAGGDDPGPDPWAS